MVTKGACLRLNGAEVLGKTNRKKPRRLKTAIRLD